MRIYIHGLTRDSSGAFLIGGNEKPEGRHAKNSPLIADNYTMGTRCENCGLKAGSHKVGTMNCPQNGPGSGFKASQTFSPVKD